MAKTIKNAAGQKIAYTVTPKYLVDYGDGTAEGVFSTNPDTAVVQADYNGKHVVVPIPPVNPTPPVTPSNGKFTIDGATTKYGTVIILAPGNYAGINIQNVSNVTINMGGVILDGGNTKDGFDKILTLTNCKSVNFTGLLTQNIGYFSGQINSQLSNITFTNFAYKNCEQGWHTDLKQIWDGTDATLLINGIKWVNCTWDNAPIGDFGGILDGKNVTNLIKNLEISGGSVADFDGGEIINAAVDYYNIHDMKVNNIDATNTYDIRLFKIIGYGDATNNAFTKIYGHAIACWSVSYGSVVKTSNYLNNTLDGSRKYGMFEFHEYAAFAIPGKTTKANLIIDGVQANNLDTDGPYPDFPATIIDNYSHINATDGALGGDVTILNAHGSNWGTKPKLPTLWNLMPPLLIKGCSYNGVAVD